MKPAVVFGAVLALALALGLYATRRSLLPVASVRLEAGLRVSAARISGRDLGRVADALAPHRPARRAARPRAERWLEARVPQAQRGTRNVERRGNVDPCNTSAPGFSKYRPWRRISATGQVLTPERGAVDQNGAFDLIIHFHGHELARKEFVRAAFPFVLLGISRRRGIGYAAIAGAPDALEQLVSAAERVVSEQEGRAAHARHLAVSAWSGGYEPIGMLLAHARAERIDGVVLLDGLHAALDLGTAERQLAPFFGYARRASEGRAFMLVTHSSIEPDGYASSTRTAHQLIAELDGRPELVTREDALGMELVELFTRGDFHVRGFSGGREADHCAHLSLLPLALSALARRWGGVAHM
jgi:hypothetical protein